MYAQPLPEPAAALKKREIDPVCGMSVDATRTKHLLERDGKTCFFCSAGCLERFRHPEPAEATPGTAPVEHTCPMHPEITRSGPGTCPKCGMALEPRTATVTPDDGAELADMTRRFAISATLTLPLLALAMAGVTPGEFTWRVTWFELALAAPVVVWGGWPFFTRALDSIRRGALNMFTLVGLGTAVAFG
jgi:YHS domain-containing protein